MHFLAGDFSGQNILDQCFVVTDLVNVHGNVFLSANVRFSSTVVGNIDCLILATEWRINAEHPACQSAIRGMYTLHDEQKKITNKSESIRIRREGKGMNLLTRRLVLEDKVFDPKLEFGLPI